MAGRKKNGDEKYTISPKLDFYFEREKQVTGKSLEEIYEDVADYLGVRITAITKLKLGLNNISLVLALKLAEYFNTDVKEMWEISENKDFKKVECKMEGCSRNVFAKELCRKHYYQLIRPKKS